MRIPGIPAYAVGQTQSPFVEISSPSAGMQEATQTLGRAKFIEGAAIGGVLDTAAAVSKDVRDFTRRIEEQEALTALQSARSKYHVEAAQAALKWENEIDGPTALSSMNGLKEMLQPIKQKYLDSAPSKIAKERIGLDLDAREADLMVHGEKVARKKFKEHSLAVDEETHNNFKLAARMAGQRGDVNALQGIIDQGNAWLMGSGMVDIAISPSEAELLSQQRGRTYVASFLQGQLDNPRTAMKAIKEFDAGQYNEKLGEKEYDKMQHVVEVRKHHLIAEARRAQAEARQFLSERKADLVSDLSERTYAALKSGQVAPDTQDKIQELAAIEGRLHKGGRGYAEKFSAQIKENSAIRSVLEENKFSSFDEQRKAVSALLPSDSSDKNYKIKYEAVEDAVDLINKNEKAMLHDPADISMRRAATVIQLGGGDPQQRTSHLIGAALDFQDKMGIPRDKQKIIPLKIAQQLAGDYETGDADTRLKILRDLDQYGPYKGRALNELKIDPGALLADSLVKSNDPSGIVRARRWVEAGDPKAKRPDWDDAKTSRVKTELANSDTLTVLNAQANFLGVGGGKRAERSRSYMDTAIKYAQGSDTKQAAETLDAPHTAINDNRLAIALIPADIPRGQATASFQSYRAGLKDEEFSEAKAELERTKGKGVGERAFQEMMRDIRTSGVWIDDTGTGTFVLIDPKTRRPVRLDGGREVRITEDQLRRSPKMGDVGPAVLDAGEAY
jgi:hypothetical protein